MKLQLLIFLCYIIFGLGQSRPQQQRDDLQKVQVVLQQQERQPRTQQSAVSQIVTKILQPAPSVARATSPKVKSQRRRPKKSKPIGIVRSVYNAPIDDDGAFDFR